MNIQQEIINQQQRCTDALKLFQEEKAKCEKSAEDNVAKDSDENPMTDERGNLILIDQSKINMTAELFSRKRALDTENKKLQALQLRIKAEG